MKLQEKLTEARQATLGILMIQSPTFLALRLLATYGRNLN